MPKLELTPQQRRALRAAAHPLHPVVLIGDRGLVPTVLDEIDRSLAAHELIKIHVAGADRESREAMLASICDALSCAAVHHLGKTLIIYRAKAETQHAAETGATRAVRRKSEPYIPKKQAAHNHDARPSRPATQGLTTNRRVGSDQPARRTTATRRPEEPARRGLDLVGRPSTHAARASRPHGITRRSGSALTLRAGRRGRTTRS